MSDGGPAFPVPRAKDVCGNDYWDAHHDGMSLRDYFAAQVAAYYLTHHGWGCYALAADSAYKMADAMLAERARVAH